MYKGVSYHKVSSGTVINKKPDEYRYKIRFFDHSTRKYKEEWYPVDDITSSTREEEIERQKEAKLKTDKANKKRNRSKKLKIDDDCEKNDGKLTTEERKRSLKCQCEKTNCLKRAANGLYA